MSIRFKCSRCGKEVEISTNKVVPDKKENGPCPKVSNGEHNWWRAQSLVEQTLGISFWNSNVRCTKKVNANKTDYRK